MTAHRITAEEIAAYRKEYSTAIYAGHTVSHINRILDALESAYAELDRLSAQGGEVPELDSGANPYQRNTENPGSFGWSLNRAYREGYDCARKLSRSAPPHPDTVEVSREEWEALLDFAERIVPIRDNISGISWVGKFSDVLAAYDKWYALRVQAQPTTSETRG